MKDQELKIEWDLNCSAKEAKDALSKAIDESNFWCFFPKYLSGKNFQGRLNNGNFKVWTKKPRRGPPPAILEGEIIPFGEESKIKAEIKINPLLRINIYPFFIVIIILAIIISFPLSMLGILTQKSQFLDAFPIFFISIGLSLVIIFRKVALTEVDDLRGFITKQFAEYKKHINS